MVVSVYKSVSMAEQCVSSSGLRRTNLTDDNLGVCIYKISFVAAGSPQSFGRTCRQAKRAAPIFIAGHQPSQSLVRCTLLLRYLTLAPVLVVKTTHEITESSSGLFDVIRNI